MKIICSTVFLDVSSGKMAKILIENYAEKGHIGIIIVIVTNMDIILYWLYIVTNIILVRIYA